MSRPAAGLLATAGACALLGGCISNPFVDAKVDPASPVAPEVAKMVRENRAWPTFADIPAAPKDLRPVGQYGREAQAIENARTNLEQATAPETWSLTGTEAFAAAAQREAGTEAAPAASAGETAAFATTQRKRATPPPPPPR